MSVEDDNFVRVAKKANFLVGHFYSAMVNLGNLFYCFLQLLRAKLDLGISYLNGG